MEMVDIMKVNHKQLEILIRRVYETKLPLFIWGTTGIGKSYTVRKVAKEIAKEKGLKYSEDIRDINKEDTFVLIDIRISQIDPSDLRGLPKITESGTKWIVPNWLPRAGQGIIFFDELNLAPPSIQASAYQLILDRRLGDYVLPDGYVIISAGNRLEDRANVYELPAPLKNRFLHVELKIPSVREWTDWAVEHGIDERVIAFINFKGDKALFNFDPESDAKAFATPRSWEFCSRMIKGINDPKLLKLFAMSAVGAIGFEFAKFCETLLSIDIMSIIKDPDNAEIPDRADIKWSIVSGLASHYEPKYLENYYKIITQKLEPEFGFILAKMLWNKTSFKEDIKKNPQLWAEFVRKLGKYFVG